MSINWKEAGLIVTAGGIGGALSLVYSIVVGNPPTIPLPEGILAYIFLGMGSGFLGVYVIAKTDTSQLTHALGFAIACGISWAPIMDASTALIKQNTERQLMQKAEDMVTKIKEEVSKVEATTDSELIEISGRVEKYSEQLAGIVESANYISTVREANRTLNSIGDAVSAINSKNQEIALASKQRIYGILSSVNKRSVAKLDYPPSVSPNLFFGNRFPASGFPAYEMAIGELRKDESDEKVLVIKRHEG